MESISANSYSAGDAVVVSGHVMNAADQSDSSDLHMMAKFESFEDDDVSAATDEDDFAPSKLLFWSSKYFYIFLIQRNIFSVHFMSLAHCKYNVLSPLLYYKQKSILFAKFLNEIMKFGL